MKAKTLNKLAVFSKDEIARPGFIGIAMQSRTKKAAKKGLPCRIDITPSFIYLEGFRRELIKHYKKEVDTECHGEPKLAFEWIADFIELTEEEMK